ncbi:MAG: collagen-like protein, partial [Enterococcus faecalis]|nr:collagen-like protein [Enterococcus faecalis]
IKTTDIMNPDGIKVGDIVEDLWTNDSTVDYEFWKVTTINGTNITVQKIGKRTFVISYNDTDVKRRITALEARPDFNSLTETQRNSLRGPAGARGANGATGPAGPRGADGAPGQNIINQNGGQPMKYWAGTRPQYDAISNKDANTIYDIYR